MNKNELMKNMSQAYLLLSEKKKEEFSRILNRLLTLILFRVVMEQLQENQRRLFQI